MSKINYSRKDINFLPLEIILPDDTIKYYEISKIQVRNLDEDIPVIIIGDKYCKEIYISYDSGVLREKHLEKDLNLLLDNIMED